MESSITLIKAILEENKRTFESENLFILNSSFGDKEYILGRSQDGGGIGRGDHFLFYKFIERTTER